MSTPRYNCMKSVQYCSLETTDLCLVHLLNPIIFCFIFSLCKNTTKGGYTNQPISYKVFQLSMIKSHMLKVVKVLTRQWSSVNCWLERIIWCRSVSINSETRYTSLKFSFCGGRIISLMDIICIGEIIDKQAVSPLCKLNANKDFRNKIQWGKSNQAHLMNQRPLG